MSNAYLPQHGELDFNVVDWEVPQYDRYYYVATEEAEFEKKNFSGM